MNTTRTDKLKVSFDMSFPEIACKLLSLDAIDDTGLSQKNTVHEIFKHKLSKDGVREGIPERHELGNTIRTEEELAELTKLATFEKPADPKCGNCYGAGSKGQCCNTCDEVKRAYEKLGWRFKTQGVSQCSSESFLENMKDQFAEDGGCQIYGTLVLNKASGHFHIAPHKQLHTGGAQTGLFNLMDLISFTFDQFNITHTINSLSFGDHFPGINSPLDGQHRAIEDTHGMYQYYIKVVPTRYKALGDAVEIESNQYAVTEHMRHLSPGSGRGLPGVYFYYELSPIQASFEEKRGGLLRFLTSVCAIVGGMFTVMGLVDGFVNGASAYLNRGLG